MHLANDDSNKHSYEDDNGKDLTYFHNLPECENRQTTKLYQDFSQIAIKVEIDLF
jgi:hypothetical protein